MREGERGRGGRDGRREGSVGGRTEIWTAQIEIDKEKEMERQVTN